VTASAGELINLTKSKLPVSSISIFVTGFVKESVNKEDDGLFNSIKVTVDEFMGGGSTMKKFVIKCRYLKTDERIDKKVTRARRNSFLMIIGELILIDPEFQIDIQDMNFLSATNANIGASTNDSTTLYSWQTTTPLGRITAQAMANNRLSENTADTFENLTNTSQGENLALSSNDEMDTQELNDNNDDLAPTTTQTNKRKKRKTK
jgi:hypothetical protein